MFYILNFIVFASASGTLIFQRYRSMKRSVGEEQTGTDQHGSDTFLSEFERYYLVPYSLVTVADWLQGPYLYIIYERDKKLREPVIAVLFVVGFLSAAISSLFVGPLADRGGRKKACLLYCVACAASYLCVLSNSRFILLTGRVLGGLSATLQYSVFEAWLVSEHGNQNMSESVPLASILSFSVTCSGMLAIASGIIGEGLVRLTGQVTTPSIVATCPLVGAFAYIFRRWRENYGAGLSEQQWTPRATRILTALSETRISALALVNTFFEASLWLFSVLWPPVLISSRPITQHGSPLPLGIIFSTFMCSMMIGSSIVSDLNRSGTTDPTRTLLIILAVASCAMLPPLVFSREWVIFQSFVLFEGCVGAYFPIMAQLKSIFVKDATRGEIYALMRLPVNIFVVSMLALKGERYSNGAWLFSVMSASLVFAILATRYCLM